MPEPLALRLADGPTVADLAARYLDEHVAARCKPKTAAMYRLIVEKHIVPALGKLPALAVGQARVTELHHGLSETPVMANQVVDRLSWIFNTAEDRGLVPEGKWRRLRGFDYLAKVIIGIEFRDGIEVTTIDQVAA